MLRSALINFDIWFNAYFKQKSKEKREQENRIKGWHKDLPPPPHLSSVVAPIHTVRTSSKPFRRWAIDWADATKPLKWDTKVKITTENDKQEKSVCPSSAVGKMIINFPRKCQRAAVQGIDRPAYKWCSRSNAMINLKGNSFGFANKEFPIDPIWNIKI